VLIGQSAKHSACSPPTRVQKTVSRCFAVLRQ